MKPRVYENCIHCGKKLMGNPTVEAYCPDAKCAFKVIRNKPVVPLGCLNCNKPIRVEM